MARCPICDCLYREQTSPPTCEGCGVSMVPEALSPVLAQLHDAFRQRRNIKSALSARSLDAYALRLGYLRLRPLLEQWLARPMRWFPSKVMQIEPSHGLELAVMSRASEAPAVAALAHHMGESLNAACVLFDTDVAPDLTRLRAVLHDAAPHVDWAVAGRAFDRDFGAQRSALQRLARRPWTLHLDTDERISPAFFLWLGGLAAALAGTDVEAVSLRRLNRVDGAPTRHWPDYVPRLIKRDILFRNAVHEVPEVTHWRRMLLCPRGYIEHFIESARLPVRDTLYAAINPGTVKGAEPERLRQPLDVPLESLDDPHWRSGEY